MLILQDIIEGVNTFTSNTMSLHSSANCTITGTGQTGALGSSNCDQAANDNSGCGSVASNTRTPNNYGSGLNSIGGGVYATEWTSSYIKVWFFPRTNIPSSITAGTPLISQFGTPSASFMGSCNIDNHFGNHSIIINTDFCGAWAGNVYSQYPNCPQNSSLSSLDACVDFVGNNPGYFTDAYWQINSIKVYQLPVAAIASSSSFSTSLSSVSPTAGTSNSIDMGMGRTTTTIPSASSYTGPLSSASSTTSSGAAASTTPAICPTYNNTIWTDFQKVQYTIACGSDLSGTALAVQPVNSFESCLEVCDNADGCTGVSYIGGNGAGTCYPKTGMGFLTYDNHTFAALRVGAYPSLSSSAAVVSSSSTSIPAALASSSSSIPASATSSSSSSLASSASSVSSSSSSTGVSAAASTSSASSSAAGSSKASSSYSYPGYYPSGGSATTNPPASHTLSIDPETLSASAQASTCPEADGKTLMDENYVEYNVQCATDTDSETFATSDVQGGFTACFTICDVTPECIGFTFVGAHAGSCYFKSVKGNLKNSGLGNNFVIAYMTSTEPSTAPAAASTTGSSTGISSSAAASSAYSAPLSIDLSSGPSNPALTSQPPVTVSSSAFIGYTDSSSASNVMQSSSRTASSSGVVLSSSAISIPLAASSTVSSAAVSSAAVSVTSSKPASISNAPASSTGSTAPLPQPTPTYTGSSPPACPTSTQAVCGSGSTQCSSGGSAYQLSCGTAYVGTVIDTSNVGNDKVKRVIDEIKGVLEMIKRAIEPTYQACLGLCDSTASCVGVNYQGTQCTLFSQITGTVPSDNNVAGIVVAPAASSSSTGTLASSTSSSSLVASNAASSSSTSSLITSSSTAAVSPSSSPSVAPVCPTNRGEKYTDSTGAQYSIQCYTNFLGNDLGSPFSAPDITGCFPVCSATSGCAGIQYAPGNSTCYLKSAFTGLALSDPSITYATRIGGAVGSPSSPPSSPSSSPAGIQSFPTTQSGIVPASSTTSTNNPVVTVTTCQSCKAVP